MLTIAAVLLALLLVRSNTVLADEPFGLSMAGKTTSTQALAINTDIDIEISGLEMFEQEFYSRLASGQNPGPMSSMIKLRGTEVLQQVQEFAVEAAGYYAQPFPEQRAWNANVEPIGPEGADVLAPRYFNGRKMTIYGGSSEVQRGIMSKVMLGL